MYTEAQLNALLAQVEAEFAPFLAKSEAEALLAKSEDSEKKPEKKDDDKPAEDKAPEAPKEGEGKEDGEAKDAPPAEAAPDAPPADGEAPPADAPAADAAACPPGDPNCDYDEEDHAHMAEMYGSMSPAELKAHHDAVRKALDAQGGMQAAAAPAAPEAPPAEAPPADAPPAAPMDKCGEMMKSEGSIEVPAAAMVPASELEMAKSELAARNSELEELKKSADVMKAFITKLFDKKKAPAGKAITDLGVIEKSEGLNAGKNYSKGEITKILTAKTNNPTLAKSDRDAITAYYTGGQVNLDSIRHLLK